MYVYEVAYNCYKGKHEINCLYKKDLTYSHTVDDLLFEDEVEAQIFANILRYEANLAYKQAQKSARGA